MSEVGEALPERQDDASTGVAGTLRETRESLRAVFRNPNLRRVQLAFAGSAIGDWAYGTAVAVWAYDIGGAQAVGVWMGVRFALIALCAPFSSALVDRMPLKRVMILSDLARVLLVTAGAVCLFLDAPPWTIYVLATLPGLFATPFMVAQRSMLPVLAERPEELTAANGTASTIESLAFFVGPALGGLLIGISSVPVVFVLNAATFLWSLSLVLGLRVPPRAARERRSGASTEEAEAAPGFLAESMEGFRAIGRDRGLVLVTVAASLQTIVAGASAVFMVVMAAEVLGTGPEGLGYLQSVFGVGSVLGGFVAIARSSRGRLAGDLTAGVLLWSLPLILVTAMVSPWACFAAVLLLGLGNPLVDVNLDTVIQRVTPEAVLGRVFGALETCFISTMAIGAVVMPFLIEWLGLRWSLLVIALPVGLVSVLGLGEMRRLDDRLREPADLPLLRSVDIFSPLSPAVLDGLARGLTHVSVLAGEVVLSEGAESDGFYIVESGQVEVTQGERVLRREGPGDYFGEIGLLRDVPRTATITAVEDTVLLRMAREDFLDAVTAQGDARQVAEWTVVRRLAT
ncbi:MFS transporter [Knoellia locipacati]|uniref:MFS transporter n=1 Tax=Knoellia locipacati TaxID=882824 RepID=UPI00384F0519